MRAARLGDAPAGGAGALTPLACLAGVIRVAAVGPPVAAVSGVERQGKKWGRKLMVLRRRQPGPPREKRATPGGHPLAALPVRPARFLRWLPACGMRW